MVGWGLSNIGSQHYVAKILYILTEFWSSQKTRVCFENLSGGFINVMKTRELNFCVSCESCLALCPMEFEQGQFLPQVNKDTYNDCNLCLGICPGVDLYSLKFKYL
ncbi:MAG: hypothetical protein ACFFBD_10530 [Candidatus Hodarchaeota archaeon]